ncbi:MAG: YbhB/YbcL family Raf kinase inhibitor-like protein [bacterium]|nr:YbhB/YbcL family Raf kinase inhibitor-like protein [bacterium]
MTSDLTLSSTAFESGASIPSRFTCDGDNASPPLSFGGVPEGAVSLALIMDDPDIPQAVKDSMHIGVFDHWVLYDLPPNTGSLEEGSPPADGAGVEGVNGAGKGGYTGPCPPKQYEPTEHRYFFRLYALDTKLDLPAGSTKAEVLSAMQGHILAEAELMGKYERQ